MSDGGLFNRGCGPGLTAPDLVIQSCLLITTVCGGHLPGKCYFGLVLRIDQVDAVIYVSLLLAYLGISPQHAVKMVCPPAIVHTAEEVQPGSSIDHGRPAPGSPGRLRSVSAPTGERPVR